MKCFINKTKNLKILLGIGLALVLVGAVGAWLAPENASELTMRLLGFATGLGASLVTCAGAWLIWKKVVGERRAHDKELEMGDERGQAINMQAQALIGFAATIVVVGVDIVALVRGDYLYMGLCTAGCLIIALTGIISRVALGKRL